jgi:REP element-mobilizing transposase RayT
MSNTYTQVYVQFVFAVENRASLIQSNWEEELYKYISGIVTNKQHKMITINGMPDHIHLFIGLNPTKSMSETMQVVKGESSEWINKKGFVKGHFSWQSGYGAFSYSRSQVESVYQYIKKQKEHHKKSSFQSEYVELLRKFEIEYDERYLFHKVDV